MSMCADDSRRKYASSEFIEIGIKFKVSVPGELLLRLAAADALTQSMHSIIYFQPFDKTIPVGSFFHK